MRLSERDLFDMTEAAYGGAYRGVVPSAGGCDEFVRLFLLERDMSTEVQCVQSCILRRTVLLLRVLLGSGMCVHACVWVCAPPLVVTPACARARARTHAQELNDLRGRVAGCRDEGEQIVVDVVPYADVWRVTPDAKTLCALLLYERLRRGEAVQTAGAVAPPAAAAADAAAAAAGGAV